MIAALLAALGFRTIFGVTGREFLTFLAASTFVLSLPLTLLGMAFCKTTAPSASAAVMIGCINGLISSALFIMVAGFVAPLIMLPAGGIGGAIFWVVRRQFGGGEPERITR